MASCDAEVALRLKPKRFPSSLLFHADMTDLHVHVAFSACQTVPVVA